MHKLFQRPPGRFKGESGRGGRAPHWKIFIKRDCWPKLSTGPGALMKFHRNKVFSGGFSKICCISEARDTPIPRVAGGTGTNPRGKDMEKFKYIYIYIYIYMGCPKRAFKFFNTCWFKNIKHTTRAMTQNTKCLSMKTKIFLMCLLFCFSTKMLNNKTQFVLAFCLKMLEKKTYVFWRFFGREGTWPGYMGEPSRAENVHCPLSYWVRTL